MKSFLGLTLCAAMVPALATAASPGVHARYRITLADGTEVVSADRPVQRGSVVTFHEGSSGALTGVPAEDVVTIQGARTAASADVSEGPGTIDALVRGERPERILVEAPAQPLQPGDIVDVGVTGGHPLEPANANASGNGAMAAAGMSAYGQPPVGAYGGGYPPGTIGPNGQPMVTPASSSALAAQAVLAGEPPTIGPNGFPIMSGNPPTIGPNGTPISSSDQPLIGANGTPILGSTATAAQPLIGASGTPVLAPSGVPGGTATVIGPNGTPVLAPVGSPGASAPLIGPNGTPVLAPAGSPGAAAPNIGSNGTPAAAPLGAGPHR